MRKPPRAFERLVRCYAIERDIHGLRHQVLSRWQRRARWRRLWLEQQLLPHFGSEATVPAWRVRRRSMDLDRPAPDFAVVAPIKSGSSDFASRLMMHPSVLPPLAKEIRASGEAWRPYFPTRRERERVAARHGRSVSGYFGPFLDEPGLPDRLAAMNPKMRVILLLRDPIARAYSHWKWEAWLGGRGVAALPEYQDFDRFIDIAIPAFPDIPLESASGYPVLATGMVADRVADWLDRFGERCTLVVHAEDYFRDPPQVLDRVQRFLDLPHIRIGDFDARVNENPLRRPPMSPRTAEALREFYAADQAALRARLAL